MIKDDIFSLFVYGTLKPSLGTRAGRSFPELAQAVCQSAFVSPGGFWEEPSGAFPFLEIKVPRGPKNRPYYGTHDRDEDVKVPREWMARVPDDPIAPNASRRPWLKIHGDLLFLPNQAAIVDRLDAREGYRQVSDSHFHRFLAWRFIEEDIIPAWLYGGVSSASKAVAGWRSANRWTEDLVPLPYVKRWPPPPPWRQNVSRGPRDLFRRKKGFFRRVFLNAVSRGLILFPGSATLFSPVTRAIVGFAPARPLSRQPLLGTLGRNPRSRVQVRAAACVKEELSGSARDRAFNRGESPSPRRLGAPAFAIIVARALKPRLEFPRAAGGGKLARAGNQRLGVGWRGSCSATAGLS